MLATLERVEILDQAEHLSKMILESEEIEVYFQCIDKLHDDCAAMELLRKFVSKKDSYEEVQRFGKYHPDFEKVTKEMRYLKREVDLNESIASFKKAENNIQKLLDEISVLIGHSVSKYIKVPTGNPFFDSLSACGGGCGTGSGCGCS